MKNICFLIIALFVGGLATSVAQTPWATVVASPDTSRSNSFYPGNRPPLAPSPFIRLPSGSIQPQGWLHRQLELEGKGFVGHMSEVSGFLNPINNAWLSPKGEGNAFWEEVPYWLRGYASLSYALENPEMMQETEKWIAPSLHGQRDNGYFGSALLEGDANHSPDLMPNQNMLYAYRAYYDVTKDQQVLQLMSRYFHWEMTLEDKNFFHGGWGDARNSDNMDMVFWLYNQTGDKSLLPLADKLMRTGDSWMDSLSNAGNVHNVAFSQGFRKPAVYYQLNKDPKYLEQANDNYNAIYARYGQVPGGMFCGDEFARSGHTDPHQAIETCGVVEMMFSTEMLLRITGDLKWMDRCENIAYNTLPAVATSDFCGLRYLTAPNQSNSDSRSKSPTLADGGQMEVMDPRSHRCCQHNISCGWPYFTESLYEATPDSGIAAMMYAPCTVTAKVGAGATLILDQSTEYPFSDQIDLHLRLDRNAQFPIYFRIPGWCDHPQFEIDHRAVVIDAKGDDLVKLNRFWASGSMITIRFPMKTQVLRWTQNKDAVSVERGPLTYSVKIDEQMVRLHPERTDDHWPAYEIKPASSWNYGLIFDPAKINSDFQVISQPFPDDGQPFTPNSSPIELNVRAKKIPNWTENYFGVVDSLQKSPISSPESTENITMIPMGCARLRMTALPVIGDGADAREWEKYQDPVSSFSEDFNILKTVTDAREPKSSDDSGAGMFIMYGPELMGSQQWIRMPFDRPKQISKVRTYWWTEHYESGGVRPPASWALFYKADGEWKPVENTAPYTCDINRYNEVDFAPITTSEIKLVIKFQPFRCASLIRWRVE